MSLPTTFNAFRIHNDDAGYRAGIETLTLDGLNPGEVVIKTAYSSVNYKDALAGTGEGKILRRFPLVGGIDVAGHVVASTDPAFKEGDAVLVTGCGLSETRDGGYAEYARLEAKWVIPLPAGLSLRDSMILGTAGFTAALALFRMRENRQTPDLGPLAVTGATGGVGSLAVDIFSKAGFEVHAISGKPENTGYLTSIRSLDGMPLPRRARWNRRASAADSITSAARCWPACWPRPRLTATSPRPDSPPATTCPPR